MTPEQFVYWMQGFAELNESPPSPEQWSFIRECLMNGFDRKTPETTHSMSLPKVHEARWQDLYRNMMIYSHSCFKALNKIK